LAIYHTEHNIEEIMQLQ